MAACVLLAYGCTNKNQPSPAAASGTLTGFVTAQSGPVGGAAVALVASDGSQWSATTGSDGYFEINRVITGAGQLTVSHDGYSQWTGQVLVLPNATTTKNVHLNSI